MTDFERRFQTYLNSPRGRQRRQAFVDRMTGRPADQTHPYAVAERLRDLADLIERHCVERASHHHRRTD